MNTIPARSPAWSRGDIVVRRIDEIVGAPPTGPWLLPETTKEAMGGVTLAAARFRRSEGAAVAGHASAERTDGSRILVDTGIGDGRNRATPASSNSDTDFLQRLSAAAFPPDSVDLVITTCTLTT